MARHYWCSLGFDAMDLNQTFKQLADYRELAVKAGCTRPPTRPSRPVTPHRKARTLNR